MPTKIANITSVCCVLIARSGLVEQFAHVVLADASRLEIELGRPAEIERQQNPSHRKLRERETVSDGQRAHDGAAHRRRPKPHRDRQREIIGYEKERRGYDESAAHPDERLKLGRLRELPPAAGS